MTGTTNNSASAPLCDQLFDAADKWDHAKRDLRGDDKNPIKKTRLKEMSAQVSKVVVTMRGARGKS